MHEASTELAGHEALIAGDPARASLRVLMLHGYGMRAEDFAPFARSLRLARASFVFPQGIRTLDGDRRAWWSIDEEARARHVANGPRDLAAESPPGRKEARAALAEIVTALDQDYGPRPVLLAGFSQGGMLACDALLCGEVGAAGLVMFSASRIALSEWQVRQSRLQGLRALVSHGRDDPDLAFAAGERLQRFLRDAGAKVIWVPFNGGHEVPFQVWRRFRELVRDLMQGGAMDSEKKLSYGTT